MSSESPAIAAAATSPATTADWSASPLGQILVKLGVVDVVDVMLAAYEQDLGDGRRIGEILMDRGLASREDIQLALLDQSRDLAVQPTHPAELDELAAMPIAAFPVPQGGWMRTFQAIALFLLLAGAVLVLTTVSGGPVFGVAIYGALTLPYLLGKLLLSSRYRAAKAPAPAGLAVSVVVPFFNEDPATFRQCLTALTTQTMPPEHLFLVDDGSATRACYDVAAQFSARHGHIKLHRFPENRGKREAQAWAFQQVVTGVVVTVDSDTVVHPEALAELVKPFADPRVNAVCGYARGLNRNRNFLTRLIDLRYTNSFLYERGAYSVLGSVLCATGVLSAWRHELVMDNQADYLNQRFLGTDVHYGDDRRLTAYALRTGRVVMQDTAMALTHVPERLPHFVRQQVRWNKSFFRESLLLLRQMKPTRVAWWLGLAEFVYWMVLTTMLLYAVVIRPVTTGAAPTWQYAAFVALMAYARSIRMIGDGGRLFPLSFVLAPLYGFMNILLLVPLRFYSLLRLRDGSWGTRRRRRGVRRGYVAPPPVATVAVVEGPVPHSRHSAPQTVTATPVDAEPPSDPRPSWVAPTRSCVDILPAV